MAWFATDNTEVWWHYAFTPQPLGAHQLACLQYTSGSTAIPKGVMLSHQNLLHNLALFDHRAGHQTDSRIVTWLPHFHDLGLLYGVLFPLYKGVSSYLLPPLSVVQKPARWLQAISNFNGSHTMGPNFIYDHCCDRVTEAECQGLDLSSWRLTINGAEPVRANAIRRFNEKFSPYGLSPYTVSGGYGLAEATCLVTAKEWNSPTRSLKLSSEALKHHFVQPAKPDEAVSEIVSCGAPVALGTTLKIVDPDGQTCSAECIGEIWLRNDSVASGYWQRPTQSAQTFGARLANDATGPSFLRTGDLGFLNGGELFITGRIKDLIIVGGSNYYPQDAEGEIVLAHPAFKPSGCAVFTVEREEAEKVIVVQELVRNYARWSFDEMFAAVRRAVGSIYELPVEAIVLISPGSTLKTSSGKIQRASSRQAYLDGSLHTIAQWDRRDAMAKESSALDRPPAALCSLPADLEAFMIACVCELTMLPPSAVDISRPFAEFGLSSIQGTQLMSQLTERFSLEVPVTAFYDYPSIQQLTRLLTSRWLLGLVCAEAAVLLESPAATSIATHRSFQELGLDNLMVVELHNRLAATTGFRLEGSVASEHSTALSFSAFLTAELLGRLPESDASSGAPCSVEGEEDPIAIVSMSCRFPGAGTPEELWKLLVDGEDAISGFPENRGWDLDGFYRLTSGATDKRYAREGGFLYDCDGFDPAFFGVSPCEALAIDPQQRLLLELAWEALERAGIDPVQHDGGNSGVFIGIFANDYLAQHPPSSIEHLKDHVVTGCATSVAAGRLAYFFDFQGPAVSVDTACSSSLVALHLAAQALQRGECTLALAGGATVMATLNTFILLDPQSAGAADGRCKAFSAEADGAGWAEGAGMLLLERVSDAKRNGHPVLALIKGSAINQDGKSQGLTAPNGLAQERVIRQALVNARLTPQDVDAVEAHGTGTPLGDPIEAKAVFATYGSAHSREQPLWLGSLKSNLGHSQAAAGVGAVIKMVLALQNRVLPKTLHVQRPSPHVDWSSGSVRLLTDSVPWKAGSRPRRAGISSFGMSGTNAHVIIEDAPDATRPSVQSSLPPVDAWPILLSAKSEVALRAQARRLHEHLLADAGLALVDVAYSLATHRTQFEHRAAVVVAERNELLVALESLAQGLPVPRSASGRSVRGKVVFVFPGQGSEWAGMASVLLATAPVFKAQIEACERAFAPYLDWSLGEVLSGIDNRELNQVDVVQPVLFAVMVSLAALWRSMGIEPDAVVGHSQGEIAAAFVAGALSLEDAAQIVIRRSQAFKGLPGKGAMLTVALGAEALAPYLMPWGERLSIAAVNSPDATLVAGEAQAIEVLLNELTQAQIFARRLNVEGASHCALVESVGQEFLRHLAPIAPRTSELALYSTVTGDLIEGTELDARHWYRNLRQTVRFVDVTEKLLDNGHRFFIEVSPHPVLNVALKQTLEKRSFATAVAGTLRRQNGDLARLLLSVAELQVQGLPVDWKRFFAPYPAQAVGLPTYAFQHERFWLKASKHKEANAATLGQGAVDHPLLASVITLADGEGYIFSGRLSLAEQLWLAGHNVSGSVILPGTALLELALLGGHHVALDLVEELTLEAPLALPAEGAVLLQMVIGAQNATGQRPLTIYSQAQDGFADTPWVRHASGTLAAEIEVASFDLGRWPPEGVVSVSIEGLYERLAALGLSYGADFQGLRAIWQLDEAIFCEVRLPDTLVEEAANFAIHPALLDAALHALMVDDAGQAPLAMPFSWMGVSLLRVGASLLRVRLERQKESGDIQLDIADADGNALASIQALTLRPVSTRQLNTQDTLLELRWTPSPWSKVAATFVHCAFLGVCGDKQEGQTDGLEGESYPDLPALQRSLDDGAAAPDIVILALPVPASKDLVAAAHGAAALELSFLQSWLKDSRLASTRLVLLTSHAVATSSDDALLELACAPLWGLARTTQSENPDLPIFLVDTDDSEASYRVLSKGVAMGHRQFALRNGQCLLPQLARVGAQDLLATPKAPVGSHPVTAGSLAGRALVTRSDAPAFDPEGTVLISGATGTLGALIARHLVSRWRVKHLLLVSRQGLGATGATHLLAELQASGAEVTIMACDVAERAALQDLLNRVPAAHPLTAIVHAAGILDDGVLDAMSPERLDRVFLPKLDAAWHLHQLTLHLHLHLSAFVLFSSISALVGSPGQANYAAANSFLDALAQQRRAQGLVATSIAWGYWEQVSGVAKLSAADITRMEQQGVLGLSSAQGLALFDAALARPEATLVAARFDMNRLAARADGPALLFRGLLRRRRERPTASGVTASASFAQQLSALPSTDRRQALLELVRSKASTVLGLAATEIEPTRSLQELGLDSLMAVELRNNLAAATGLSLQVKVVLDHPTPEALVVTLLKRLEAELSTGSSVPAVSSPEEQDGRLIGLLRQARVTGAYEESLKAIETAMQARVSTEQSKAVAQAEASPVRLSSGPQAICLLCFPSFLLPSGPIVFARFAAEFRGRRDLLVVPHSGYRSGQPLPENLDDLVASRARLVLASAGNAPFVLLGHSSGGWVAYRVAEYLERIGRGPVGVVLLDSHKMEQVTASIIAELSAQAIETTSLLGSIPDTALTAMAWYSRMFFPLDKDGSELNQHWQPPKLSAPVLHVQVSERMNGLKEHEWRSDWDRSTATVTVSGDHNSMLQEKETATAVEEWIASLT
ncbi:SDR family NAD(P)-dependent oxidoreductase [Pseudomonas agarici]|uniref:SDR family NAD(P)-dependent oxidoreductase n=1 Tax=Pseudomonas agarici TaxID=46677 RepID=UPI0034E94135